MVLRVKKKDSAYVYQLLESYEGLANYSTLTEQKGLPYRDILLHVAPDLRSFVETVVAHLAREVELELLDVA